MRNVIRCGMICLLAAAAAAGSASADPPPWAGKGRHDRNDRHDRQEAVGMPILRGIVIERDRGAIEVREEGRNYRVDISDADIRGAERGRIQKGARVHVWGESRGRRIEATRVQVLGDNDRDDRWDNRPGCDPRPDRPGYDPRYGRPDRDRYDRFLSGRVTHVPSAFQGTREIRVSTGAAEWTVEIPRDARIRRGDEFISMHRLNSGEYVRIEGERIDSGRFRADRVEVAYQASDERPRDQESYRGSVKDVDEGDRTFRFRVNIFETYTVRMTRSARIVRDGREVSFREIRDGRDVRVHGHLDPNARTLDARLVEML